MFIRIDGFVVALALGKLEHGRKSIKRLLFGLRLISKLGKFLFQIQW